METIVPMMSAAVKICGRQKIVPGEKYRLSRHCMEIPCESGTLLFHTLTGALYLLHADERNRMNDPADNSVRQELIQWHCLVPEHFQENKYADEIHRIAALLSEKKRGKNAFIVLTTTDCNARCFYCYEMGARRFAMDEKTAQDVAEYIAREASDMELRIDWFGGEPLYNIPPIDIITSHLKRKGIPFHSNMTSNGFYLTESVVKHAKEEWKLDSIQITIDGTRDVYNRTKAYIDTCSDPFERVLNNIGFALDAGIQVFIRLNVDRRNAKDVLDVIDTIGARFQGREHCRMLIAFLRPFARKIHAFSNAQEAIDTYRAIAEKIRQYGMFSERELKTELLGNRCMADNDASELIMPDGRIGKCEHFRDDQMIGSIYSQDRNQKLIAAWKERCTPEDMPECKDCMLYPRCINLKMCPWTKLGCTEEIRVIRISEMRDRILKTYQKWRAERT